MCAVHIQTMSTNVALPEPAAVGLPPAPTMEDLCHLMAGLTPEEKDAIVAVMKKDQMFRSTSKMMSEESPPAILEPLDSPPLIAHSAEFKPTVSPSTVSPRRASSPNTESCNADNNLSMLQEVGVSRF